MIRVDTRTARRDRSRRRAIGGLAGCAAALLVASAAALVAPAYEGVVAQAFPVPADPTSGGVRPIARTPITTTTEPTEAPDDAQRPTATPAPTGAAPGDGDDPNVADGGADVERGSSGGGVSGASAGAPAGPSPAVPGGGGGTLPPAGGGVTPGGPGVEPGGAGATPPGGTFGDGCEAPGDPVRCEPDVDEPPPSTGDALIDAVNAIRVDAGCAPLDVADGLAAAAQAWADEMAATGTFGYSPAAGTAYGENIAVGIDEPGDVVVAWMNTGAHRANIVNCTHTVAGSGTAVGDDGPVWVATFGD